MRLAVLSTGGKDSTLALYKVLIEGHEVKHLVSMIPRSENSWMFHYPNMHLMDMYAEAVGIPLVKAETLGLKEAELEDLKRLIAPLDVEGVVSGTIASTYQKTRIERVCSQLGLECLMPLWQNSPIGILREILNLKFKVIITGVYAYGFSADWLGRRVDEETVSDLQRLNSLYGVSLVGEGGEYETLVVDGPIFKKRIAILEAEKIWERQRGYYRIKLARLEDKDG
ncbi:MAG: TIGR00289 family protein [Candidatus Bathyarchaeota archaeon]|nr:TIGR00289 family protein [Candidatus Bathyarchaeota archaeon]MCX8177309.1 TIGR00289 family protein [Candidatus Bathyarchaeota archaeon]MDW8193755.1 TIGR00289 family protein [Nitrososphaerota archaeon]